MQHTTVKLEEEAILKAQMLVQSHRNKYPVAVFFRCRWNLRGHF